MKEKLKQGIILILIFEGIVTFNAWLQWMECYSRTFIKSWVMVHEVYGMIIITLAFGLGIIYAIIKLLKIL